MTEPKARDDGDPEPPARAQVWVVSPTSDSVTVIDAGSRAVSSNPVVGSGIRSVSATGDTVWCLRPGPDGAVFRVAVSTREVLGETRLAGAKGVHADAKQVWVTAGERRGRVVRLDPETGSVIAEFRVDRDPYAVTRIGGELWVTHDLPRGRVSCVDAGTGQRVASLRVESSPRSALAHGTDVWVANSWSDTLSRRRSGLRWLFGSTPPGGHGILSRIESEARTVTGLPVGLGPLGMCTAGTSLWVAHTGDKGVLEIDAGSGELLGYVKTGMATFNVTESDDLLWCTHALDGLVTVIDPNERVVVDEIEVEGALDVATVRAL